MALSGFLANHDEIKHFVWAVALVQARLLPLFVLLPFTNRSVMPAMLRNVIALALGVIVAPMLVPEMRTAEFGGAAVVVLLVKEAILGFMLGFLAALPFWAVEAAGFIIDNQRGASMAATVNPLTGHDTSPLGILFNQAFMAFFFVVGGLVVLLGMVYDSYVLWHPLHFWPTLAADSAAIFIAQLNRLVTIALLLAAPVLIVMFMAEIGLALISRFAPQLQVFFLAMPIKSAAGMLVLVLYAGLLFDYSRPYLDEMRGWVMRLDPLWSLPAGGLR